MLRNNLNTTFPSTSGQVRQLIYPREIHGNPVSEEGSLVTMHWGFDIVDYIYRSSGLITKVFMIDNLDFGIRADLNEVLVTQKPL